MNQTQLTILSSNKRKKQNRYFLYPFAFHYFVVGSRFGKQLHKGNAESFKCCIAGGSFGKHNIYNHLRIQQQPVYRTAPEPACSQSEGLV